MKYIHPIYPQIEIKEYKLPNRDENVFELSSILRKEEGGKWYLVPFKQTIVRPNNELISEKHKIELLNKFYEDIYLFQICASVNTHLPDFNPIDPTQDTEKERLIKSYISAKYLLKAFEYKDYKGSIEWSKEDLSWYGKILGISDLVSYEGEMWEDLERAFRESVDDYINTKKELQ